MKHCRFSLEIRTTWRRRMPELERQAEFCHECRLQEALPVFARDGGVLGELVPVTAMPAPGYVVALGRCGTLPSWAAPRVPRPKDRFDLLARDQASVARQYPEPESVGAIVCFNCRAVAAFGCHGRYHAAPARGFPAMNENSN